MKRDNSIGLVRGRVSDSTSARFFGLVEAIGRAMEPTQTQLDALHSSYTSTGEYLVAAPEFDGLLLEVHGHGSRPMGLLVRPLDIAREGFDMDLIARLGKSAMGRYGDAAGPARLLDDLYAVGGRYAQQHGLKIVRWERCVTLEYSGGMTADIAPVIDDPLLAARFGDTHARIPDRDRRHYAPTNPRGFMKFFDIAAATPAVFSGAERFAKALDVEARADVTPLPDAQQVFDRLLCRLIQLIKLHRNVSFGQKAQGADTAPTSVFLTTLATKAYLAQAGLPHDSPLDLLLDVIDTLPDHIDRVESLPGGEVWYLQNPASPHDNLAAGMNTQARQQGFAWWHRRIAQHVNGILSAIESHAGWDVVLRATEEAFGERAAQAMQSDQAMRRAANRTAGRVALIPATGMPVSTPVRRHNFFGMP